VFDKGDKITLSEPQHLIIIDEIYRMHPETGRALFQVQSKVDNLLYALKVFDLKKNKVSSIQNEMLSMNRLLQRPELFPRFRSYSENNGYGFLRMDWMSGKSLERVYGGSLPKGKADLELRMKAFENICETVSIVHKSRLVHRDIKPANILLRDSSSPGSNAILIDFGLSFERRSAKEEEGTRGYSAPEQIYKRDFEISSRTDMFSLAQVACWLICGKPYPLICNDDFNGWENLSPGSLQNVSPFINLKAESALIKGLSFLPKDRPHDMQTFKLFVREILK